MENMIIEDFFKGDLWRLAVTAQALEESYVALPICVLVLAAVMVRSRINFVKCIQTQASFVRSFSWAILSVASYILAIAPLAIIQASDSSIGTLKSTSQIFAPQVEPSYTADIDEDGSVKIRIQTQRIEGGFKEVAFFRSTKSAQIFINEETRVYSFSSPLKGRSGVVRTLTGDEFRIFMNAFEVIERFARGSNGFI